MRRRQGMTLVEVLVAAAVGAVLLTIIGMLLMRALHLSTQGTCRAALATEAGLALESLATDLGQTGSASVTIVAGPPCLVSLVRLLDLTSAGAQVWDQAAVIYRWDGPGSPVLRLRVDPSPAGFILPGGSGPPLPATLLPAVATTLPVKERRVLAQDVQAFSVLPGSGESGSLPYQTFIALRRQAIPGYRPESFSLSRTTSVRNR